MSAWTIYHNPRCSKSRQTLELLNQNNIEPQIVEYLQTPPSVDELKDIVAKLDFDSPKELARSKEALFKEKNLSTVSDEELLVAMSDHPSLIERPIVVKGDKAVLGRPPENIEKLL